MIVGTWNLENLFRWGQDDGPSSQEAYDAKLEELRRVVQTFAMPALHMLADSRQREASVKSLNIFSEEIFFRDVLQPLLAAWS